MADNIRWGILGTGWIANRFVEDLARLTDHQVVAVGSRRQETAAAFASRFGIDRAHASYESLAEDSDVDVVYISTPHPRHLPDALTAVRAGKSVLVEKPFTLNAEQAVQLVEAARAAGVFAMEAMWTRFLPHMRRIRDILDSGALGDIRTVIADHGQRFLPPDPTSRLYAPELGGGALLDLGIYPVSFASYVLGTPATVTAVSDPTATGVDAQTSMVLQYDGGAHALLTTTLGAHTPTTASITGTAGRIDIDGAFYQPTSFSVVSETGATERRQDTEPGNGLRYEAAEVGRCLRDGLLESPTMPLQETVTVMTTMDEIRRQIGLSYPDERGGDHPAAG